MGLTLYLLPLAVLFLLIVFGLGWYQKRKKNVKSKLRLVVSNDRGPTGIDGQGKTFERHLEAVKSPTRPK
jgi:preprotein translocase subunit SecG